MKTYLSTLAVFFALMVVTVAPSRADSITTFTVNGTFSNNSKLSGTFTLDATTGKIVGFNLVTGNATFTPSNSTAAADRISFLTGEFEFFFQNDTGGIHSLDLVVNGPCSQLPFTLNCSPVGYNGGNRIPNSTQARSAALKVGDRVLVLFQNMTLG